MIVIPQHQIDEYKKRGWWGNDLLEDKFQAILRAKPLEPALIDPPNTMDVYGRLPKRLNWRETADLVDRYAAMLVKHGLRKDDIIITQLPNIIDIAAIYLACARLGIIVSPAPCQYRKSELSHIVEQVEAKALFTAAQINGFDHIALALELQHEFPCVETVFCMWGDFEGTVNVERHLENISDQNRKNAAQAEQDAAMTPDDILSICWTSGTEAKAKGVPRSHNEWFIAGQIVVEGNEMRDGARLLNAFPMVNMAGFSTAFFPWILVGGVMVLHHPFNLTLFLDQIRNENIENTVLAPAVLNLLLQDPSLLEGIDFTRLRNIGSGSAPLSEWMVETFQKDHGVHVANFFGANEGTSLLGTYRDIPNPKTRASFFPRFASSHKWSSSFRDKNLACIVDPDTDEEITETGRAGELRVKGPSVFSGYWNAPDGKVRTFDAKGWFRTGDLFEIAGPQQEYYKFCGRLKDVIIRGGMNISSEEIEALLLGCPGIADAAVVGAPDTVMGERVCAFVVQKPGQTVDLPAVNAYLTQEKGIAIYKQVERLELIDAMPRNPVGKIVKAQLREALKSA